MGENIVTGSYDRYAKYNGKEYLLNEKNRKYIICTQNPENADEQFEKGGSYFYRVIERDLLSDIYRYMPVAVYAGIQWDLTDIYCEISENAVKLTLHKTGVFDGWEVHEQSIHTKWIDNTELEAAAIGFLYERKDGVEYNPPLIEEKRIKISDLYKYHQYFKNI